ncbi:uncharacterized protein B0P05DRAFT_537395 [Gilbertella persicaria]|uniref:uncharacterized protein n=1 Tax=Gilbertella persicaria TaxID=101096 RepID=UPI00221F6092|nr:uncharacterized protein B0P05DRAFT_537395 [Gilbertella persicaria]KAI8082528.1 hypothetical protein B0P05DRAFT_537395 [Gilbertella persicaria]
MEMLYATMFTTLAKRSGLQKATNYSLIVSRSFRTTQPTKKIQATTPLLLSKNKAPLLTCTHKIQRHFSIWNLPLKLMTASPLQRRLTLIGLGGLGLATAVVLGPFLLVGLGSFGALVAFRIWRFKRQLKQHTEQDWPDYITNYIRQQPFTSGLFGQDQRHVQSEALRRFNTWAHTDQGHHDLIEMGIHPDHVLQNVSMRGSSYSSSSSTTTGQNRTEIKIELDLRNAPGSVLIARAELDKESNELIMRDIRLVTASGCVVSVPLSAVQQNRTKGRIIEGEFRDVQ